MNLRDLIPAWLKRILVNAYLGTWDYVALHSSDKTYMRLKFFSVFHRRLNLKNPQSYSEKLQWLKLYDRNPLYTKLVDKYAAKQYVTEKVGGEYVIPMIGKGVWDKFEDIPFESFPNQFVLKTTHDSGSVVVCTDKSQFDYAKAKTILEKSLKHDYYKATKEWPYKDVPRRIIAEKYMVDESGYELKDYKWFCFDGEPKALFIATDRGNPNEHTKFDFYDMDFNHLPFTNGHENATREVKKPKGFEEMKRLAGVLSQGLPHVRVDFYDINGKVYFGEMTFYHWSGFMPFEPEEWDYKFGEWIKLPAKQS